MAKKKRPNSTSRRPSKASNRPCRRLGHQTDRIGNGRQLVDRLAAGDRWDLVFNIAEGLHGLAREAQVPAILDLYQIPYTFSDPMVLALTLHKGMTKAVVRDAGLATADFAVVERIEDVERVDLPMPLFAKPVAEGTGKGVTAASKIADRDALRRVCAELLAKFRQPVLIETFLAGREFTVGIVGSGPEAEVLGSMEVVLWTGRTPRSTPIRTRSSTTNSATTVGPAGPRRRGPAGRGVGPGRLSRPGLSRRQPDRRPLRRRRAGRISSRSTLWPASIRSIPICPSFAECVEYRITG